MEMQKKLLAQMKRFNDTFQRRQRIAELRELMELGDADAINELRTFLRTPVVTTTPTTPTAAAPAPAADTDTAPTTPDPAPTTPNSDTTSDTPEVIGPTDTVSVTEPSVNVSRTLGPRRRRPQVYVVCFIFINVYLFILSVSYCVHCCCKRREVTHDYTMVSSPRG